MKFGTIFWFGNRTRLDTEPYVYQISFISVCDACNMNAFQYSSFFVEMNQGVTPENLYALTRTLELILTGELWKTQRNEDPPGSTRENQATTIIFSLY